MDYIEFQLSLPDGRVTKRFLPTPITRPDPAAQHIDRAEFERETRRKIFTGQSLIRGHNNTTLWYMRQRPDHYYVLHIKLGYGLLKRGRDILVKSLCTWTPSQGIDALDNCLVQDIEDAVLLQELQRPAPRLDIFNESESLDVIGYMTLRGLVTIDPKGDTAGVLNVRPIII